MSFVIDYNGYLTENKLFDICKNILFKDFDIFTNKSICEFENILNCPKRYRYDIVIPELKLTIEFDGYRHFQNSKTIFNDIEKDKLIREKLKNWKIIRIPYYVQLDNEVLKNIFGITKITSIVKFEHGFIDKKALRVKDFSILGLARFHKSLEIYHFLKTHILKTLDDLDIEVYNLFLTNIDTLKNYSNILNLILNSSYSDKI